jgi:hypothetical protein
MRNRRISTILASSLAGLLLLPFSAWAARNLMTGRGAAQAEAGVLSAAGGPLMNSIDQARLEADAHRTAAEAAATSGQPADQPDPHAARQRASRSAVRPRPAPAAPAPAPAPVDVNDVWVRLRHCEAGGNYSRNSGNGYYGAYQFSPGTWHSLGYSGLPSDAPPQTQDEAAHRLQQRSGWGQWPACSRRVGAR